MKKHINDNIAIVVAIVLIFVYVVAESYTVNNSKLLTQTAVVSTVNETISTKAIIVRDEHTISNNSNGVVVPCFADGDKVKANSNIAMVFPNQADATSYSNRQELEKELKKYTDLQSQSSGIASNINSLNKEIGKNVNDYIRRLNKKDVPEIKEKSSLLNDALIRRQLLIGESVDFTPVVSELNSQISSLSNVTPNDYVKTQSSGIFTSYTDGYEDLIDYKNVSNLSVDEVSSYIESASSDNTTTGNIGKLITSYNWYMLCVVNTADIKNMRDGDNIKIALKNSEDSVIKMKIVTGAEPKVGQEQTVLVLKSNDLNSKILNQRLEDIEIICEEYTGVKVPVDAVHIDGEQKGVYALVSTQVQFRKAEVIYTTDEYVLLSYDVEDKDGIRLYDQIIIQGKELSDGKVYT